MIEKEFVTRSPEETEKLGREFVDSKIKELTTDVITHTSDAELFNRVRAELGNALNEKY